MRTAQDDDRFTLQDQLPDKQFIACSYKDYLLASSNEIPERWLRAQERP